MKKMILGATALLFVGTAFAQSGALAKNVALGNVIGANNDVFIDQTSDFGVYNYSEIVINGSNNFVDVDQLGGNDSYIVQTGSNNDATVMQVSVAGPLPSYQISNVDQLGNYNTADVYQGGTSNVSDVDQNSIGAVDMLENEANVLQGTTNAGSAGNSSVINQSGSANFVRHTQNGDDNEANSNQTRTGSSGLVVTLFHLGSHITQDGDRNFADVDQDGSNQISYVTQTATTGGGVMMYTNEATIIQNGENNRSEAIQGDSSPLLMDADNYLMVTQTNTTLPIGVGNVSMATQNGANSHIVNQNN